MKRAFNHLVDGKEPARNFQPGKFFTNARVGMYACMYVCMYEQGQYYYY